MKAARRAAAEAGAIGEQQLEVEANGKQQWKRMPQSGPGAAAEADAIGENQLFRELSGAGLRTVGEQGSSVLYVGMAKEISILP